MAEHKQKENGTLYYLMIGMVVLLLIFSVVQTVQISALKEKARTGSSVVPVAAAAPAPQAPRAAPVMVGGC